jgi:mono/diheme cytochrome c family protein
VAVWLAGTVGAAALVLSPPAMAGDLVLGAEVFNGNCAACHTGGNNTVQVEKTLRKADIEKYLDGGLSIEAITYQARCAPPSAPAPAAAADPALATAIPGRAGPRLRPLATVGHLPLSTFPSAAPPQVQNGKNAMPAWEDRLSEEEIDAVRPGPAHACCCAGGVKGDGWA